LADIGSSAKESEEWQLAVSEACIFTSMVASDLTIDASRSGRCTRRLRSCSGQQRRWICLGIWGLTNKLNDNGPRFICQQFSLSVCIQVHCILDLCCTGLPPAEPPICLRHQSPTHTCTNPFIRGIRSVSFYIYRIHLVHPHSPPACTAMEDPRFCSACRAGPFANVKNHLNKCKETKRRETEFMSSVHGVKRHGPELESEIRKRWQPPDLIPQVRASGESSLSVFSDRLHSDVPLRSGGLHHAR
jgi:hypothetical protein